MPAEYGFDRIALELACPALGHLAAAGIAGAEKKDFRLVRSLESLIYSLRRMYIGKKN